MIKSFWHRSPNFGDALTPYLFRKLGVDLEYVEKDLKEPHHIICGSIITAANEYSIVWGAGVAQYYKMTNPLHIAAVRGLQTGAFLIEQGIEYDKVYGDVAMLLPLIYPKERNPVRKHETIEHIALWKGTGWYIGSQIEDTIDFILGCEKVTTTSFHVKLTCDVYGVPCTLIHEQIVIGSEFKYNDYLQTKEAGLYDLDKFINACPVEEIKTKLNEIRGGNN